MKDMLFISPNDRTLYQALNGYLDGYGPGRVRINPPMKTSNFHGPMRSRLFAPSQCLHLKYVCNY